MSFIKCIGIVYNVNLIPHAHFHNCFLSHFSVQFSILILLTQQTPNFCLLGLIVMVV